MFPLKKPIVSSERKKKREWREGVPKPQNLESAPSKETRQKEQCNRKRVSGLDQDKLVNQAKEDWDWEEMEEEDGGLLHTHTQNKVQEISSQPVTCVRVTCSEMTMITLLP